MIFPSIFLFLGLLSPSTLGLALRGPQNTRVAQSYGALPFTTDAPQPTEAPSVHGFLKRQNPQRTLIAAPDQTCGYFSGSSEQPWGCSTGNCVFASATTGINATATGVGKVLCCGANTGCPSSPAPTACVDRGRNDYTCTGSCLDDPAILTCTSGKYLYCNTVAFQTPLVSAYFCNYVSTYAIISATTTFSGKTDRSFTPTVAIFAVFSTSTQLSSPSTGTTSSSTSPSTTEASAGPKKPVNKGAIIGGTLAGAIGLGMIVTFFSIYMKWRNTPFPEEERSGDHESGNTMSPSSGNTAQQKK